MDKRTEYLLDAVFRHYDAYITDISTQVEYEQYHTMTMSNTSYFPTQSNTKVVAMFKDSAGVTRLLDDLNKVVIMNKEELLRRNNPTIAQAYEEYMILLNLIK